MPTFIRLLTPNGLKPAGYTADSLHHATRYEPSDGIYTVTNTYHGTQVLKFSAHLDRMEDSARRAGIDLTLDRARLRWALRHMIAESGFGDVRFRVTVSAFQPEIFILTLEPFTPLPPEILAHGVKIITAPNSARQNPMAKTTDWMHRREALAQAQPEGVYDTLLMDADGHLLEGLGANFYGVLNDTLRTAGDGVLLGISRQIVLEVAPTILPVNETALHISDLPNLQEAFITSSSRGVVPVVAIDSYTLGDGTPAPYTRAIYQAYQAWLSTHLEEL